MPCKTTAARSAPTRRGARASRVPRSTFTPDAVASGHDESFSTCGSPPFERRDTVRDTRDARRTPSTGTPLRTLLSTLFLWFACTSPSEAVDAADFTSDYPIDTCAFSTFGGGPYFNLDPGRSIVLAGKEDGSQVVVEIETLDRTEVIHLPGATSPRTVSTRVVEEREFINGGLSERAEHYYARCIGTGDIYYFGESLDVYGDGEVVSHLGSWRTGENGAVPGVVMPGTFLLGSRYFHQQAPGAIRDMAENVASGFEYETALGIFEGCVRVREYDGFKPETPPSIKVYAPGVGIVDDDGIIGIRELRLGTQGPPTGAGFTSFGSHPFLPFVPGLELRFAGGPTTRVVRVLETTLNVNFAPGRSVETRIVEEETLKNGSTASIDREFLAQCVETGDVFVFGREVAGEDGGFSWLAGVDGAVPVLKMPGVPVAGAVFSTAAFNTESDTFASVVSSVAEIQTPAGGFANCLQIETPGVGGSSQSSLYAPGIGLVAAGDEVLTAFAIPGTGGGAPVLSIQSAVILSWPVGDETFEVETSSDLAGWSRIGQRPQTVDGNNVLPLPRDASRKHFRLVGPSSEEP